MLDTRLNMIYDLIPQSGLICDIGADHCKLAVYAVQQGKTEQAVATDLRLGPLEASARTVSANGLSDRIRLIRSDGFADIPADIFDSTDCFAVAGMGGLVIQHILEGRLCRKWLVLQPMNAVYELCQYLAQSGYDIKKRVFCTDGHRIYTAFLCRYDGISRTADYFKGAVRNKYFYMYLEKELKRIDAALAGIGLARSPDTAQKQNLEQLRKIIIRERENES